MWVMRSRLVIADLPRVGLGRVGSWRGARGRRSCCLWECRGGGAVWVLWCGLRTEPSVARTARWAGGGGGGGGGGPRACRCGVGVGCLRMFKW